MMLWAVLTLLSALSAWLIARPFLSRQDDAAPGAGLAVYRAQLAELERDVAQGTVTAGEAAQTRAEIERRVLAAARAAEGERTEAMTDRGRMLGVAIAVGWVVVGSALLYGAIGRPDLPAAPSGVVADLTAAPAAPGDGGQAGTLDSVDAMTAGLAARLAANPEDPDGWRMLGWSYASMGRFADAVAAYARAADQAPADAETWSLLGEAQVNVNQGRTDAAARESFGKALALDPANPRAQFFKGVMLDEDGDTKGAVDIWLAQVKAAPADATWVADVTAHLSERAAAAGIDLSGAGLAAAPAPAAAPGPSAADMAAAQAMTPEARSQMIRGMVDGLAARLETQPDDPDGWVRLIRAYGVLGDQASATAALAKARAALAGNAAALAALDAAAAP